MNREKIMEQWDSWREYIANGGKSSWPRDEFEGLLDYFEDELKQLKEALIKKNNI